MMDDEHQQIGPESAAPRHIPQHDRSPRMPAPDHTTDVRACRVCGCTDDNACPPTCSWVGDDLCSTCADKVEALGSHLLAEHGDYHVNDNACTVCICGHIADGDDDDGSHARHVAEVVLASDWLAGVVADARAQALSEATHDWQWGQWAGAPRRRDPVQERVANAQYVTDWLRARAEAEAAR